MCSFVQFERLTSSLFTSKDEMDEACSSNEGTLFRFRMLVNDFFLTFTCFLVAGTELFSNDQAFIGRSQV